MDSASEDESEKYVGVSEPHHDESFGWMVHWTGYVSDPDPTNALLRKGDPVTVFDDAEWGIGSEICLAPEPPEDFGIWSVLFDGRSPRRIALESRDGTWLSNGHWAFRVSREVFDEAVERHGFKPTAAPDFPDFPDSLGVDNAVWSALGSPGDWIERVVLDDDPAGMHGVQFGDHWYNARLLEDAEQARSIGEVEESLAATLQCSEGVCLRLSDDAGPWAVLMSLDPSTVVISGTTLDGKTVEVLGS